MSDPIEDSQAAFPYCNPQKNVLHIGMRLRDYFAAQYIAGSYNPRVQLTDIGASGRAKEAYQIADAMLKERLKDEKD